MSPREAELTRQLEQALQANAALQRENQLLREKVNLLVRRIFGASSEKMDAAQLELLLSGSEPVEPAAEPKAEAPQPKLQVAAVRKPKTPRLPETLPVVEEVIDPEPVKAAPEQFRQIGQEVSEQLDYEPARYFRRRLVRRTYVSKIEPEKAPVTAPLPPTCRFTGRNRFWPDGMGSICRGKPWRAGWSWPRSGSPRCINRSKLESWPEGMCRWTRPRSITWSRERVEP
jgi:hypothetical protein